MPAIPSPRHADSHDAGRRIAGRPAVARRRRPLAPSRRRLDADRIVGLFCLLVLPAAILLA